VSRVKEFAHYLRDRVAWEDEAYLREAIQMYADAINEAASGWFPRSYKAWFSWFTGAMFIGAMVMALAVILIGLANGDFNR
jgi:hypothetical protein